MQIPQALDDALVRTAKARGMTIPEFVRLALAVAVDSIEQHEAKRAGVVPRGSGRMAAEQLSTIHDHVAGPLLSGGIRGCVVPGCAAVKVGGSWVIP